MSKEYKKAVEANRKYNYERKIMNDIYMRDIDREKRIESIFNNAFFNVENEINRLYMSYAKTEGISVKEAKKRASEMDVKRFQDMAKKAVENKDFSAKANYWLKIYNLKMRVSRYELMKASISLEIQNMYKDSVDHIQDVLEEEILNEIENQAGILAPSFEMTKDDIEKIINMDFQGKNFSKRVWDKRDGYYKIAEKEIFKSLSNIFVHKMGYQKEMSRLSNTFKASKSQVLRLLKTEVSRANSQARDKMYKENGFTHYRYVCEPGACPICKPMDNKVFKLDDREIGVNAAPMHPNCRCRDYGIIEMFKNGKSNIADDIVGTMILEKENTNEKTKSSKKNKSNSINYSFIKSKEYKDKFKKITNDVELNQLIYNKAIDMLKHRNNTNYEDMYVIDSRLKKVIGIQRHSSEKFTVSNNKSLESARNKNIDKVVMHNHPNSLPPSGSDFAVNSNRIKETGVITCHNGDVYIYRSNKKSMSGKLYDLTVAKYQKMPYNLTEEEAYKRVIKEFIERGEISCIKL